VHGVGGALGVILLGVLGSKLVNPNGADGLLYGGTTFFWTQVAAVVASSIYAFLFTWGMLWLINRFTPVRTTELEQGTLDESLHGESAYVA
jgi:Amt family ammonium transporter